MPNQKVKTDHYSNFGGVNTKASKYLTGPSEVLASFNNDGSLVGDFTGRPGSTQYFSATFANTGILGLSEFTKLNGYSKIMVANPGGMWLGQDNSVVGISMGGLATDRGYTFITGSEPLTTHQVIPGASFGGDKWDFVTHVDHQFFCDGNTGLKFNGVTHSYWGLPDVIFNRFVGTTPSIYTITGSSVATGVSPGFYYFAFAYQNERGFVGPARVDTLYVNVTGTTPQAFMFRTTFPIQGYGITAMNIYSYWSASVDNSLLFGTAFPSGIGSAGQTIGFVPFRPDESFRLLKQIPIGTTQLGPLEPAFNSVGDLANNYAPFGQTNTFISSLTGPITVTEQVIKPKFFELFKDIMFWVPENSSSAYFSDPDTAEPESWNPEWEIEFRTNDGDKLRAMKVYGNRLMFGKELSLHELTGDDAETFLPREISTDYGIINNRACCTWEGRFWFLDRKGIAEYTGGLPKIISEKVEEYFQRMNLAVAKESAQMIYMKNRNEVWTLIPIDGATKNNILIIFDTVSNQWYFWDGPNISILAKMIGRFGKETSFYGDYSNRVNSFGASFMGDNGSGFTQLVQFRFEHPMGESVESLYRRLFLNADSMVGSSPIAVDVKLRANYGTSYQVAASMVLTDFQEVLNFGIPAKSLSVEVSHFSAVDSMRLHGYALEHRWLRNT